MMRIVKRYSVWAMVVLSLAALVYFAVHADAEQQRERRLAIQIDEGVEPPPIEPPAFRFIGPSWLPFSIQEKLPLWRIWFVTLEFPRMCRIQSDRPRAISTDMLKVIGTLSHLERLALGDRDVTDANVEHLGQLKKLTQLRLHHTNITDDGLASLRKLKSLRELSLDGTQTTPEGRVDLRKALPNCTITPDP